MKKVLYIISTLNDTGPVNIIYETIKNLDRNKYEPCILTLSPEGNNSRIDEFKKLDVKVFSLNLSRLKGYLSGKTIFKNEIKKINPDIMHAHCFRSALFLASAAGCYHSCVTVHCDYTEDFPSSYGAFIGNIMRFLYTKALKKIPDIYCVSSVLADILNKKIKNIKFSYVDNGINIYQYTPINEKEEMRKKLNLPLNKKLFIYVGLLSERKNPKLLIDAFKDSSLAQKNIYLILRGSGNLKEECIKEIGSSDNIRIVGRVENLNEYYQASDYYVTASLSEGLPGAVIEAMACGLPVVLSDIEQHKYVLREDNAGLLFKTNDKNDLVEKIKEVLEFDYDNSSNKAREIVTNNYSSQIMTEKYQQKYEELLTK